MSVRTSRPAVAAEVGQAGAVAVLLLATSVVVAVAVVVAVTAAAAVLLAEGRAQDLADEAAISAVHAGLDEDPRPCARARAVVASSRPDGLATLGRCELRPGAAVVHVDVRVTSPVARRVGLDRRGAEAAASIVPRQHGGISPDRLSRDARRRTFTP